MFHIFPLSCLLDARGVCWLPVLLPLLLITLYAPCHSHAATTNNPEILFGVVLPLSTPAGQRAKAVLELALSDVNNGRAMGGLAAKQDNTGHLPIPFRFDWVDSGLNIVEELSTAKVLLGRDNLMALIGSLEEQMSYMLGMFALHMGVTIGNCWATTPSIVTVPSVIRNVPSAEYMAVMAAQLAVLAEWKRVAVIYTEDDKSQGMVDVFLRQFNHHAFLNDDGSHMFEVSSSSVPADNSQLFHDALDEALEMIIQHDTRIFYLLGTQSAAILKAAKKRGLIGPNYQWYGDFCTPQVIAELSLNGADASSYLKGTLCITPINPKDRDQPIDNGIKANQNVTAYKQRLIQAYPHIFSQEDKLITSDLYAYDLVASYVISFQKLFADDSLPYEPYSLRTIFQSGTFTYQRVDGSLGMYIPNGDTWTNFDILNWQTSVQQYVVVAEIDIYQREFVWTNDQRAKFEFSTGGSEWIKDRAYIFVDGDVVPYKFNTEVSVLAFIISVLGLWTGLILMEQSSAFWLKLEYKQAIIWTSLASVAMGVCGIWPNFTLQFCSIDVKDFNLFITPAGLIVSLIYSSLIVLFALVISQQKRFNGSMQPQAHTSTKGHKESSHLSHASHASQSSQSNTVSSNKSLLSTLYHYKRQAVRQFIDMSRYHLKGLVLTAAIWTGAIEGTLGIQIEQLTMHGTMSIAPEGHVIASAFTFFSMIIGLMLTRTVLRYVGSMVIGLIILGHYQIILAFSTFTLYNVRSLQSDAIPLSNDEVLIIALVSGAICLALMVLNVNQLRITKNMLDKVLAKVNGQIKSLESDIEHERLQTKAYQEQSEFLRRNVELINLCRPIFRPYAVALALADPNPNTKSTKATTEKTEAPKPKSNKNELTVPGVHKPGSTSNKDKGQVIKVAAAPQSGDKQSKSGNNEEKSPVAEAAKEVSRSGEASKSGVSASSKKTASQANETQVSESQRQSKVKPSAVAAAPASTSVDDFTLIHPHKEEKQLMELLSDLNSLTMSGAPAAKAVSDIKLPQLLAHPVTMEFIKDVLTKQLSPENMALWLDIQRYRSLEQASVRKAMAEEIFSTFIQTGAKFEVNLSSSMKEVVQTKLFKGRVTIDLFDDVEREIYRLINTNNIDTLVQSNMFKLAAMILSHPSYKLNHMHIQNNATGSIGGNLPFTFYVPLSTGPIGPTTRASTISRSGAGSVSGSAPPLNRVTSNSLSQNEKPKAYPSLHPPAQSQTHSHVQPTTARSVVRPSAILVRNDSSGDHPDGGDSARDPPSLGRIESLPNTPLPSSPHAHQTDSLSQQRSSHKHTQSLTIPTMRKQISIHTLY